MAINTILPGESLYEAFNNLADRVAALVARTAALEEATTDLPQMKEHVQQLINEVGIISVQVNGLSETSETHTTQITTIMVALDSVTARVIAAEADILSLGGRLDNVESDLDDKLDKKTTSGAHVYAHTGATQNEIEAASDATGGTVALRTSAGNIKAAEPTENNHVATKKYVDDHGGSGDSNVKLMTLTDPGLVASHTPTEIQACFTAGKTVICRLSDDNGYYFAEVNYKGSEGYLEIVCTKSAYTTGEGGGYSAEVSVFRGLLSNDTWVGVGSENVPTASDLSGKVDKKTTTGTYVYTHNGTTQSETVMSNSAAPTSIPYRDGNGRIYTGAPMADLHAATKKYVDDAVAPEAYTLTLDSDETSATLTGGTYEQLRADIMAGKNVLVTMASSYGNLLTTCTCCGLIDGSTYMKFYVAAPWGIKYTISFDSASWGVTKA